MVDTVQVNYLYPPDMLSGGWDEKSGNRRVTVRLAGSSDGTGETDVHKIVLTDLKTTNKNVPTRTAIEWIEWQGLGMGITLEWDRAPNALIARLNQNGVESGGRLDWSNVGGLVDPGLDDRTGDIMLSSSSPDAGDTYDITMCIRLKD